jgi:hypothetical protein
MQIISAKTKVTDRFIKTIVSKNPKYLHGHSYIVLIDEDDDITAIQINPYMKGRINLIANEILTICRFEKEGKKFKKTMVQDLPPRKGTIYDFELDEYMELVYEFNQVGYVRVTYLIPNPTLELIEMMKDVIQGEDNES